MQKQSDWTPLRAYLLSKYIKIHYPLSVWHGMIRLQLQNYKYIIADCNKPLDLQLLVMLDFFSSQLGYSY